MTALRTEGRCGHGPGPYVRRPDGLPFCRECKREYTRRVGYRPVPRHSTFWDRVSYPDTPGCWVWTGPVAATGYGTHGAWSAHRLAWRLSGRDFTPGRELHHLCANKLCVKPGHLVELTRAEHARFHPLVVSSTCIHGHPRTGANVHFVTRPNGATERQCRPCGAARARRYRSELTAVA